MTCACEGLFRCKPSGLARDSLRSFVKRAIDLTGALVGLMLLTPVMLVIALLIRIDSGGPILFRQLRRGYRGRLFGY